MCIRNKWLIALAASGVFQITAGGVSANGLSENRPWNFSTPNERAIKARNLELMKLEDAGTYEERDGGIGAGGFGGGIVNTVYGEQNNCIVVSVARGNEASNAIDGESGTLTGVDDAEVLGATTGESAMNTGSGEFNVNQSSSGQLSANADGNTLSSSVGSFSGSGTTDQTLESTQSVQSSPVTASANNSTACDGILN